MEHPIISVITPCYNQEKYLSEAVDSVLYQTFQNWEMVIVDDGSTDGSANTAKMYAAKDTRIHYVYQQNAGPSAARNKGVKNSQGQYLMFLDGDNKLDRTYLEKAVCHMDSHPDTVVFMTRAMHFGTRNDEFMIRWKGYNKLLLANTVDCGCVVRRIDFETVGGFDEKLRGGEDWELFIRLLSEESHVFQHHEVLFYYRVTEGEQNVNSIAMKREEELCTYIYQKHKDKYSSLDWSPLYTYRRYHFYKQEYEAILQSRTYKVGKMMLAPLKWVKRLKQCF